MSEFPVHRCESCGETFGYPVFACRSCGSETFVETAIPGTGELYASTVIRVPGERYAADAPYEVGIVDVDGGTVRITARIEGTPILDPGDPLVYLKTKDGVHMFEAA